MEIPSVTIGHSETDPNALDLYFEETVPYECQKYVKDYVEFKVMGMMITSQTKSMIKALVFDKLSWLVHTGYLKRDLVGGWVFNNPDTKIEEIR